MAKNNLTRLHRRHILLAAGAGLMALSAPSMLRAQEVDRPTFSRNNISSFQTHDWRDHFDSLGKGLIPSDTTTRALQHWTAGGEMRIYPTSVPLTDELTKRGYTEVIRKVEGPSWAPTPSMKKRNSQWPDFVPPGPENPPGTHALYLSWRYYRIHGTHDTRKIGRRSSNGCIGLYNEHIAKVFALTPVGTKVKLI